MSDYRPIWAALLGVLLALAAAVVPTSVLAQTPTPVPTATATATPTPVVTPTPPPAPTTGPTRAQLESATYPVPAIPGGTATLVGGKFEVAAAPAASSAGSPEPRSCSRPAAAARYSNFTPWTQPRSRSRASRLVTGWR
ncbi:MAG: hypothetical protein DWI58_09305 [Chloroflexi bacterium]|nr:MAG: hypothetical protein DWI58_09305 [Chloroflexota bacterium]